MKYINYILFGGLAFTPIAFVATLFHAPAIAVFVLSALALIPLAKFIGDATEELANHSGPGIGGLLNATFGNATELIVGIFALHAGLLEVVRASIAGSILGNLLLVLGTAAIVGGAKRERQHFNATAAKAGASMLAFAVVALSVPAVLQISVPTISSGSIFDLSLFVAVLMICGYVAQLLFSLRTHAHLYRSDETDPISPRWSVPKSILVLGVATIGAAVVSDGLVGSITPLVAQFGWNQLFIGAVVIAIVGNAAEHASAVQAAIKNRMDLAVSITVGSATQIVSFVAPVLVLISVFLGHPMSLVFDTFELVALILTVFVTNSVIEDGQTTWFEGVQLLLAYVVIAAAYFVHP
jgi:Ca2+:H+ antiporter